MQKNWVILKQFFDQLLVTPLNANEKIVSHKQKFIGHIPIDSMLAALVIVVQKTNNPNRAIAHLKNETIEITPQDLMGILFSLKKKLETAFSKKENRYIHADFTIFTQPKWLYFLLGKTKILFRPKIFFIWFAFVLFINVTSLACYGVATNWAVFNQHIDLSHDIWIFIFFSYIIGVAHELGHVSAYQRISQERVPIKFGFYFIFPVFFVELRQIYLGSKQAKSIVNLAGVALQLVMSLALIVINLFLEIKALNMILYINMISATINLIPLGRSDGYWLFCDLVGAYNIKQKLAYWIKNRIILRNPQINVPTFIILYGIINAAAICIIIGLQIVYLTNNILGLPSKIIICIKEIVKANWSMVNNLFVLQDLWAIGVYLFLLHIIILVLKLFILKSKPKVSASSS